MKRMYQIADRKDSRALAEFLSGEGQLLLPMLELDRDINRSIRLLKINVPYCESDHILTHVPALPSRWICG